MEEHDIRAALDRHWAASDANDFEAEHQIYREDAVLEYPQSGERIRGRRNIQASRFAQPNRKRFTVRRILGGADLWVTEFVNSVRHQYRDGHVVEQVAADPAEQCLAQLRMVVGPSNDHVGTQISGARQQYIGDPDVATRALFRLRFDPVPLQVPYHASEPARSRSRSESWVPTYSTVTASELPISGSAS
jgi:hypothetical protein